ncbi:MAG: PQQ-binding-like beta-propeller repeat protein [Verrucomicrobia bacterium]|nr:PQQ-binding-like beta-propeller repeat protein [Verrucomicrobiota bacterium]
MSALPARSLIFLILALPAFADDWPMLGHDAQRSGATTTELRPPFARKWYRLFADEGLQAGVQPVLADDKVFLGTLAGVLHAMDAETGKDLWGFKADGPILHAAGFGAGKVFFGAADGVIHAVHASDGKPAWRHQTGAAIWNAPAIHAGVVCVGSRDGHLYAFEADTGRLRWRAPTGAPLLNSPTIDPKRGCVHIGSEAVRVHAFSLADGRELWRSELLPGASMRGYHPVIAPDGSVMVTTQPVIGYNRFQDLLLQMVREVFGDFASWRHSKEENQRLRARNFLQLERPETYSAQLDYLRRRLIAEPAYQTFFVLDPETGRQRCVAPIVASESMNGPGAPPVVTADGRVIVKYQVLLRSRYQHYSPFLNVGYLDTATGHITPLMDQTRTYGWHDSMLLVHDEQCQLSAAGRLLLNTHQDNVNALDLDTLKGYPEPLALNIHEPAKDEALAIRLDAWRGRDLSPGKEWLIRGTAVYGGGSALDVPVSIAGDSFYYVPTHEINSGCGLVAYRMTPGAPPPGRIPSAAPKLSEDEWKRVQELPWDWDTLATPRLKNLLEALPGPVAGTLAAPLNAKANEAVAAIPDGAFDEFIWKPAWEPSAPAPREEANVRTQLQLAVRELISQRWRPLVLPAGKAPEESYRVFNDPSQTLCTLLLCRQFLDDELQKQADRHMATLVETALRKTQDPDAGESRVPYDVPRSLMRIIEEPVLDDLARLYPLWLWSRIPSGAGFVGEHWQQLRDRLRLPPPKDMDDCGNSRLAGLIAYCRLAKAAGDDAALQDALRLTRQAMRERLQYELAHTRGGVLCRVPHGRMVIARWRRLTPDVAALIAAHARDIEHRLMATYVDYHRPGWWLAWNVEQLMRNEAPMQLPTTPLDIFTARALVLQEPAERLRRYLDLPWCRADEFYLQKLALVLRAQGP